MCCILTLNIARQRLLQGMPTRKTSRLLVHFRMKHVLLYLLGHEDLLLQVEAVSQCLFGGGGAGYGYFGTGVCIDLLCLVVDASGGSCVFDVMLLLGEAGVLLGDEFYAL